MAGAAKGYKVIITLPEKMSQEKCDTLKGLGATFIIVGLMSFGFMSFGGISL